MALLASIVVVTNTTLVSVTQRTREIGVRRALGATRRQVVREVLLEATLVALAGAAAALLGIWALASAARAAGAPPLSLSLATAAWSVGSAAGAGVLAGLYPALPGRPRRRDRGPEARMRRLREWLSLGRGQLRAWSWPRCWPTRCAPRLAVLGIVIGIVTVVLVASILANLRNQVALLFRELGTENVFAYHRSGDPYAAPSEKEARRLPLDPAFAEVIAREGRHVRDVGVQLIVPAVVNGRALVARAGASESDRVFVEGVSAPYFDVVGSEIAEGRPFSELEARSGARVCVLGANVAKALYGSDRALGRRLRLAGEAWSVVGVQTPRKGGFFGENRNDNVIFIPLRAAERRFAEAKATVLYVRARPGQRDLARVEVEAILRRLRRLAADQPNDFELSTADQIIRSLDQVSAAVGLVTFALAAVSLLIGGIGVANVMVIAVSERTREIGVRRALGARRAVVLRQFLLEAALLSSIGGVAGVRHRAAARARRRPRGTRLLGPRAGLGDRLRPRRLAADRRRRRLPPRTAGRSPRPRRGPALRVTKARRPRGRRASSVACWRLLSLRGPRPPAARAPYRPRGRAGAARPGSGTRTSHGTPAG